MSQVDKNVCLAILKRGLRVSYELSSFHGPAKNWTRYGEPDFQEFAQKHGIDAETVITIHEKGGDIFGVQIMQ